MLWLLLFQWHGWCHCAIVIVVEVVVVVVTWRHRHHCRFSGTGGVHVIIKVCVPGLGKVNLIGKRLDLPSGVFKPP